MRHLMTAGLFTYFISLSVNGSSMKGASEITVATTPVQTREVARNLSLIGNLRSKNSVVIASQVNGKIEEIYIQSGDTIQANTALLSLEQAKAKAALAEEKAALKDAQRKLHEFTKLFQRGALTKTELDAQQSLVDIAKAREAAAQVDVSDRILLAPFSGTVGLVDIQIGQLVSVGEALVYLDDLSQMQLDVKVPEAYLSELDEEVEIIAYSKAWKNQSFKGHLSILDTRINPDSLNLTARINIDNANDQLRPGMLMEVVMQFKPKLALTIPVQAIEYSGTKRFVYRIDAEGKSRRTEVKLGARFDNTVSVESGLTEGDRIVIEGLVRMRDGVKVKDLGAVQTAPAPKLNQSGN